MCSCYLVLFDDALGFLRVLVLLQSVVTGGDVAHSREATGMPLLPSPGHTSLGLGEGRMGRNQSEACAAVLRHSESMSQVSQKQGNFVKTHKHSDNSSSSACFSLREPPRWVPSSFLVLQGQS